MQAQTTSSCCQEPLTGRDLTVRLLDRLSTTQSHSRLCKPWPNTVPGAPPLTPKRVRPTASMSSGRSTVCTARGAASDRARCQVVGQQAKEPAPSSSVWLRAGVRRLPVRL